MIVPPMATPGPSVTTSSTAIPAMTAEGIAVAIIRALIKGDATTAHDISDPTAWGDIVPWTSNSFAGAEIIQTLPFQATSTEATIAVSLGTPPGADGTITEPFAVIVHVHRSTGTGWLVDRIGYA